MTSSASNSVPVSKRLIRQHPLAETMDGVDWRLVEIGEGVLEPHGGGAMIRIFLQHPAEQVVLRFPALKGKERISQPVADAATQFRRGQFGKGRD